MPEFYKFVDLCVGQKIYYKGYKTIERSNYELDLSLPYEKLWEGFTSDCRRNIQIGAKKKSELTGNVSPEELINLFAWNKGAKVRGIKIRDYERLKSLMNYCISNKKGKIIGVRDRKKRLDFWSLSGSDSGLNNYPFYSQYTGEQGQSHKLFRNK